MLCITITMYIKAMCFSLFWTKKIFKYKYTAVDEPNAMLNVVQWWITQHQHTRSLVLNSIGYEGVIYFIQKLLLHNISISVLFLSGSVSQSGHCIRLWGGETGKSSYSSDMFWIRRCSWMLSLILLFLPGILMGSLILIQLIF